MNSIKLHAIALFAMLLVISGAQGFNWQNLFKDQAKVFLDTNSEEIEELASELKNEWGTHSRKGFVQILKVVESALDSIIGENMEQLEDVSQDYQNNLEGHAPKLITHQSEGKLESLMEAVSTLVKNEPILSKGFDQFQEIVNGDKNKDHDGSTGHFESFKETLTNITNTTAADVLDFTHQLAQNFNEEFERIDTVKTELIKKGIRKFEEGVGKVEDLGDVFNSFLNQNSGEALNSSEASTNDVLSWLIPNHVKEADIPNGNIPEGFHNTLKTVLSDIANMLAEQPGKTLASKIEAVTNHFNKTLNENFGEDWKNILPDPEKFSNKLVAVLSTIPERLNENGTIMDRLDIVGILTDVFLGAQKPEDEDEQYLENNKAKITGDDEPKRGNHSTWVITTIIMGASAAIVMVVGAVLSTHWWSRRRVMNTNLVKSAFKISFHSSLV